MSPIHVRAEPGELAERVLLPGDPRRARYIAETFFDEPRLVTEERGLLGFTGTYEGMPVSVQTSGMGCPSASIVHSPSFALDDEYSTWLTPSTSPVTRAVRATASSIGSTAEKVVASVAEGV